MGAFDFKKTFDFEMSSFYEARRKGLHDKCRYHLGRAHILSQKKMTLHLRVHLSMLSYGFARRDIREVLGQIIRLLATTPGHLINRLPKGNIGFASVGMLEEMEIPEDLKIYFV